MTARRHPGGIQLTLISLSASLLATAVVIELRKPAGERTWHGSLGGVVPYDLRPPTWKRIRDSVWSPDDPRFVVPRAFGVGWTFNIAAIAKAAARRAHGT